MIKESQFSQKAARRGSPLPRTVLERGEKGVTLAEVMVSAAVAALVVGVVLNGLTRVMELGKWQSVYETACSYAEQSVEYALFVPYANLSTATPSATGYVTNGMLYTTATTTNLIATTRDGVPCTLTNVTHLATQPQLPLDDLGSYVVQRNVYVTDSSIAEAGVATNIYKLITVSNVWSFRGKTNLPIVYRTIRDNPSL